MTDYRKLVPTKEALIERLTGKLRDDLGFTLWVDAHIRGELGVGYDDDISKDPRVVYMRSELQLHVLACVAALWMKVSDDEKSHPPNGSH